MDPDQAVRQQLLHLLQGGNAHATFEQDIEDFPLTSINTVFPNGTYSAWHLLEHMRMTQWDILDFIRNPNYEEREWPKDYWPSQDQRATEADWNRTIQAFQADMQTLQEMLQNPHTDLYARIPHGAGQNILREMLLVADHNAYHMGEFAIMRQVMGTWGKNH